MNPLPLFTLKWLLSSMSPMMPAKNGTIAGGFPAVATLAGFLSSVGPLTVDKGGVVLRTHPAPGGLLPSAGPLVLHEAGPLVDCHTLRTSRGVPTCSCGGDEFTALPEGVPTLPALVGLLFTVQPLVLDKVSTVPEGLPTGAAGMRLPSPGHLLIACHSQVHTDHSHVMSNVRLLQSLYTHVVTKVKTPLTDITLRGP